MVGRGFLAGLGRDWGGGGMDWDSAIVIYPHLKKDFLSGQTTPGRNFHIICGESRFVDIIS
jgi:hypothetical protein